MERMTVNEALAQIAAVLGDAELLAISRDNFVLVRVEHVTLQNESVETEIDYVEIENV